MEHIADWLKKLGLAQYTQSFVDNGIDVSVLRDLTDQDLKDLGILLGHRRKILRAIGGRDAPTLGSEVLARVVPPRETIRPDNANAVS